MWFAGLIILAHNIVPHHHHFEVNLTGEVKTQLCCHDHFHGDDHSHHHHEGFDIHECTEHDHENDHIPCHFNIETTTSLSKISLDLFAKDILNGQFFYFPTEEEKLAEGQILIYSSVIHELKPLRGPPSMG